MWNHTGVWLCLFILIWLKGRKAWPKLAEGQKQNWYQKLTSSTIIILKSYSNYIYLILTLPEVQRITPRSHKIPICTKIRKFTYVSKIISYQRRVSWQDGWPKCHQVSYQISELCLYFFLWQVLFFFLSHKSLDIPGLLDSAAPVAVSNHSQRNEHCCFCPCRHLGACSSSLNLPLWITWLAAALTSWRKQKWRANKPHVQSPPGS